MLFAKTAYSTMHTLVLTTGALRINAANGLIPNADIQKQDETSFLRPLFLRKPSLFRFFIFHQAADLTGFPDRISFAPA